MILPRNSNKLSEAELVEELIKIGYDREGAVFVASWVKAGDGAPEVAVSKAETEKFGGDHG